MRRTISWWEAPLLVLMAVVAAALGGCAERTQHARASGVPEAPLSGPSAGTRGGLATAASGMPAGHLAVINARCPLMVEHALATQSAAPKNTRIWRQSRIGFCCQDCTEAWDAMSDTERTAALVKVNSPVPQAPR